jgi:hypothetical protein
MVSRLLRLRLFNVIWKGLERELTLAYHILWWIRPWQGLFFIITTAKKAKNYSYQDFSARVLQDHALVRLCAYWDRRNIYYYIEMKRKI